MNVKLQLCESYEGDLYSAVKIHVQGICSGQNWGQLP